MTILRIRVDVQAKDIHAFESKFYEFVEHEQLNIDNVWVDVIYDANVVYFVMPPEQLNDELSDLIGGVVHHFGAHIHQEVEEV